MKLMTEEITPEFIERMTDRVIARLTDKLDELDISLDFIGAVLANTSRPPKKAGSPARAQTNRWIR